MDLFRRPLENHYLFLSPLFTHATSSSSLSQPSSFITPFHCFIPGLKRIRSTHLSHHSFLPIKPETSWLFFGLFANRFLFSFASFGRFIFSISCVRLDRFQSAFKCTLHPFHAFDIISSMLPNDLPHLIQHRPPTYAAADSEDAGSRTTISSSRKPAMVAVNVSPEIGCAVVDGVGRRWHSIPGRRGG